MKQLTASLAAAVLAVSVASAAQGPSFLGTWTLNLAKSKFDPGPPLKSETRIYTMNPDHTFTLTEQIVDASGQQYNVTSTYKLDGKVYPISGNPNMDMIHVQRIGRGETRATQLRAGKVVGHLTTVVSKDGRTRTLTQTLTNLSGQVEHDVMVFDRQ